MIQYCLTKNKKTFPKINGSQKEQVNKKKAMKGK